MMIAAGITKAGVNEKGEPVTEAKYSGLHALRHVYTSWCINRRVDGGLELPAKVVQHRLGRSSITVTLDTYGHLFPFGDDAAELAGAQKILLS
jgi:integrase